MARFYYADKALTAVASELDSFDGRAEPERCSRLVGRLRQGQVNCSRSDDCHLKLPHENRLVFVFGINNLFLISLLTLYLHVRVHVVFDE